MTIVIKIGGAALDDAAILRKCARRSRNWRRMGIASRWCMAAAAR